VVCVYIHQNDGSGSGSGAATTNDGCGSGCGAAHVGRDTLPSGGGSGSVAVAANGGGNSVASGANDIVVGGANGDKPSILRMTSLLEKGRRNAHLMYGSTLPRRGWSLRTMGRHMFSCGLIAASQDASTRADVRAIMEQLDFGHI
jgi:hypothetical protein